MIFILNRIQNYQQSEIDKVGRLIAEGLEIDVFWGIIEWDRQIKNNHLPEYHYIVFSVYKI